MTCKNLSKSISIIQFVLILFDIDSTKTLVPEAKRHKWHWWIKKFWRNLLYTYNPKYMWNFVSFKPVKFCAWTHKGLQFPFAKYNNFMLHIFRLIYKRLPQNCFYSSMSLVHFGFSTPHISAVNYAIDLRITNRTGPLTIMIITIHI